jgi:2'-5' RNA ligase
VSKRLFVSVDLPPGLAESVASVQERVDGAEGLDFVDPAQAHVTLKFLGDTDPADLNDLTRALAAAVESAGVGPFEVEVGGLGAFPSHEYISVLWVGIREGGAELTALHEAVEAAAVDLGFDPEDHDFTPHVTIARMRDARGKDLVQRALAEADPTVGRFEVDAVTLTESTLTADGPVYEAAERFEL